MRNRQIDRQTDRQTGRQADRHRDRQTYKKTDKQTDIETDRQPDRGMGRISYNGALCIGNLNRMGRIDGAKWVGLHFFTKIIFVTQRRRPKAETLCYKDYFGEKMQSDPLRSV